jgi:hypothetical protein
MKKEYWKDYPVDWKRYFGTSSERKVEFEGIVRELRKHLGDCTEFDGFDSREDVQLKKYFIGCKCNRSWCMEYMDLSTYAKHANQLDQWVQGANMFAYKFREDARQSAVPIDEVISPIFGFLLEREENVDPELEHIDVDLF